MSYSLNSQLSFIDSLANIENEKPKQYILREYQKEAVNAGVKHLLSGRKPGVIVSATGSGKSVMIANIAKELNGHVLLFAPSKELLEQNYNKLLSYNQGVETSIYSASFNSKEISKITFCTIGSVYKKPELFAHFQYIIIDECDYMINADNEKGMWKTFLSNIGNKPLVGLTASPFRLGHNSFGSILRMITRTNPKIFHDIIYHNQIEDLINQGYISDCQYYQVGQFDTSMLRINSTGSDYTDDSVKKYYKDVKFDNTLLDVVKRLVNANRKHILVFTKFIEEAKVLAQELGDISAVVYSGMKSDERADILKRFKNGEIIVTVNVGILTTGFDFPELDTVVIGRPMRSLRLYYQMIGRSIRMHFSKQNVWIVDLCGNYATFGEIKNLWLTKDIKGQWQYINKKTGKPLTNVYF